MATGKATSWKPTLPGKSFPVSGDLLILFAALIWGVAFYFQKIAMLDMGPLLFLGLRGGIAMMALLPFAISEQRKSRCLAGTSAKHAIESEEETEVAPMRLARHVSVVPSGLVAGIVFFLAAATQQTGIVTATVTNTGFLTALYVVVTPFLFWIVRRQRPGPFTWISVVLAFSGVWALSGGTLSTLNQGDILVACSAIFWASLIIVSGESAKHGQPLTYTCTQFAVVALIGLVAASMFESIDTHMILAAVVPILYVGILSSALTFGLMAIALQHVPAPRASILLSMETVFAAMVGYLLLGERLNALSWMGAALILMAVVIIKVGRD